MHVRGDQLDQARARITELERKLDRFQRMTDTSFGGIPMAQMWADLWLWEAVLNDNPKLEAIFELGTWKGGLSWWLWAQAKSRRMRFKTVDVIPPERVVPEFVILDIFADAPLISKWITNNEPCVVFCDGGNKPRELQTFSAYMQNPCSLFAVHDWGSEFFESDVPDWLTMVYRETCEEIGSITRFFRPKEDNA